MKDSVQVFLSERLSIKLNKFYSNQPTILVTAFFGTVVVFSAPSMLVFASWHVKSKKINLGGKEHNFLSEYGYSMECPNLM